MKYTDLAFLLISNFEGLSLKPYRDGAGIWSIGHGHTKNVNQDTPPITPEIALQFFHEDIAPLVDLIEKYDPSLPAICKACVLSFGFNCGAAPMVRLLSGEIVMDETGVHMRNDYTKYGYVDVKGNAEPGLAVRRNLESALYIAAMNPRA